VPPLSQIQEKNIKHTGNITMDDIIEIARVMRPRSCAKTLAGTCKEMLGTAQSVGCTIDHMHPQEAMAKVRGGASAQGLAFKIGRAGQCSGLTRCDSGNAWASSPRVGPPAFAANPIGGTSRTPPIPFRRPAPSGGSVQPLQIDSGEIAVPDS
jgi:hypothetical protein